MIKFFQNAKHWQIFILTFGIPILLEIGMMPFIFISQNPLLIFYVLPIIFILTAGGTYSWQWSIAIGLQDKIPSDVKMKVKKFKIFFFIPFIYLFLFLGFIAFMFLTFTEGHPSFLLIGSMIAIIIPLHLFSMFCIIYSLYFAAKTFKTVELQREVFFSDFIGEFFMIWFFPIGVWFIQPKVNKMVENTDNI